ncbi:MAG: hypothetical protein HYZ89_04740 [Candidatus Omnitrophica bacterium]|nr:hypothetical protein [Candidatus Omnitrophota bacterium]
MAQGTGMFLLTAAAGYWILERAETHKSYLKRVGRVLGWVMIAGSLVGVACRTCALVSDKTGWCPLKDWSCPYMQKSLPPSSP